MRTTLCSTLFGTAIVFGWPGLAFAEGCADGVTVLAQDEATQERIALSDPDTRLYLRDLMGAAQSLHQSGYIAACDAVLAAVRDMTRTAVDTGAVPNADGTSGDASQGDASQGDKAGSDTAEGETGERDESAQRWEPFDYSDGAVRAKPLDALGDRLSSGMLVDAEVRTMAGDPVGSVDGFLTESGRGVTHLIIGYGGFLGVGDREVAVPAERIRFDMENVVVYVDAQTDWLDELPDWDKRAWFDNPEGWVLTTE